MTTDTLYELSYHITDRIPEDAAGAVVDAIRKALHKAGGTPVSEGTIERMTLAYPIIRMEASKNVTYRESYFGWMRFRLADAAEVAAIAKHVKSTKDVVRHLLVELPEDAVTQKLRRAQSEDKAPENAEDAPAPEKAPSKASQADIDKEIDSLVDSV